MLKHVSQLSHSVQSSLLCLAASLGGLISVIDYTCFHDSPAIGSTNCLPLTCTCICCQLLVFPLALKACTCLTAPLPQPTQPLPVPHFFELTAFVEALRKFQFNIYVCTPLFSLHYRRSFFIFFRSFFLLNWNQRQCFFLSCLITGFILCPPT